MSFNTTKFNKSGWNSTEGSALSPGQLYPNPNETPAEPAIYFGKIKMGTDNEFIVSGFSSRNAPSRSITSLQNPRLSGRTTAFDRLDVKVLTIDGWIVKDSAADLNQFMRELKKEINVTDGTLIVNRFGNVHGFKGNFINFDELFNEEGFYINTMPVRLQFECINPFGESLGYNGTTFLNKTSQDFNFTIENSGTANANPIFYIVFNSVVNLTETTLTNLTNGEKIIINESFSPGDVLKISTEDFQSFKNNVPIAYSGIHPQLLADSNLFGLQFAVDNIEFDLTTKYKEQEL